jgi:hypothetical protein
MNPATLMPHRQLFAARLGRRFFRAAHRGVDLEVSPDVFFDGVFLAGEGGVAFSCELMFVEFWLSICLAAPVDGPVESLAFACFAADLRWRGPSAA